MGNSNGWAESRRYSLDLKPDSDNANVGKYMSEMIGFCVRAPCFLCELGAPLFTDADRAPDDTDIVSSGVFCIMKKFF